MNAILRLLLAAALLLAQVLPAPPVADAVARRACAIDCCAIEAAAVPDDCGCSMLPDSEPAPQPPVVLPVAGRSPVPQIAWTGGIEEIPAGVSRDDDAARQARPAPGARMAASPHVRLAVLFCSFLT